MAAITLNSVSPNLDEYLGEGEEILLGWTGGIIPDEDDERSSQEKLQAAKQESGVEFGATDQRIVYMDNDANFKDIDYRHISSVESSVESAPDPEPFQLLGGVGVFFAAFGIGLIFLKPILGILLTIVAFGAIWFAVDECGGFTETFNWEEKTTGYKITFITGNELHSEVRIKTGENVGADISRIVRENQV